MMPSRSPSKDHGSLPDLPFLAHHVVDNEIITQAASVMVSIGAKVLQSTKF